VGENQWARLKPENCKCIVVGKRLMATDALQNLSNNNVPIEYIKTAINLGFTFSQTLTWDDHINTSVGKMYAILKNLYLTNDFLPTKTRETIAKM